ncbi:hypothetical protein QKG26_gp097 [Chelonid alphaherpesvirus 5]|uniref:Uncharacterized protein n=1 Tax=Chelonid alphaherpesvirus 5 TaxID=702736 RepID=V5NYT3_9ALPH|nr:hypothetical protein QKG26_gp097 [Chelonid alphaherpesvirus 5]AHA93378.1 hypothetical protein [Chelonid alphaherpesvirus 5]
MVVYFLSGCSWRTNLQFKGHVHFSEIAFHAANVEVVVIFVGHRPQEQIKNVFLRLLLRKSVLFAVSQCHASLWGPTRHGLMTTAIVQKQPFHAGDRVVFIGHVAPRPARERQIAPGLASYILGVAIHGIESLGSRSGRPPSPNGAGGRKESFPVFVLNDAFKKRIFGFWQQLHP